MSPDVAALSAIGALQQVVTRATGNPASALRFVAPASAHVTMHFLGEVELALVARLPDALGESISIAPFDLAHGPPVVSPSRGLPRVIWLPVTSGVDALAAVHRHLVEPLRLAGITIESRPFAAHLTLARVRERDQRRARGLGASLSLVRSPPVSWRVHHVTLFESDLSAGAPRYTARHRIALRPK